MKRLSLIAVLAGMVAGCVAPPAPQAPAPPPELSILPYAQARVAGVVVSSQYDLSAWVKGGFHPSAAPKDTDAGTATPITDDGYFLTADHVVRKAAEGHIHLLYGRGKNHQRCHARLVWHDSQDDLALLHAPIVTPAFYRFSPPEQALAAGTPIFHGGLTTGLRPEYGVLNRRIGPERLFTPSRRLSLSIALQPGDSGGPVLDRYGQLLAINSSVEFLVPLETPIFTESTAMRPNVRALMKIIDRDRRR
jgi:S1-C subfamily serine protease